MSLTLRCHCGATQITLPHAPLRAGRCNCTYCARAGAIWGYYGEGELTILANEGERTYTASGMNMHHFCGNCGMQTWGDSPDWSSLYNADGTPKDGVGGMPTARSYSVNLNLIDDFDWSHVTVDDYDGRHNW
ncbi:aldehyde-activating protein [Devosia sp. FKR38]|uniref:GFA family protein n=1 Tax=Devosia sp. FKR38 TaxID=2562312 RepID=UPI0010BF9C1F|nr:aldehyde-activating protein [Devosia sp. FKR38]